MPTMHSPQQPSGAKAKRTSTMSFATFVLVCASMIPFGAHYMKHSLGPLKPFFISGQNGKLPSYTSLEFGSFLSAVSWPNLITPLFAGLFVDSQGHQRGALLFAFLALFGHVLFTIALGRAVGSFSLAILGRVIYGTGEGGSGVVQGAMIGKWFHGDSMGLAIGVTESVHYLSNWVGKALPAQIATYFDSYIVANWYGCVSLFLSCLFAIGYAVGVATHEPFVFALARNKRIRYNDDGSTNSSPTEYGTIPPNPDVYGRDSNEIESAVSFAGSVIVEEELGFFQFHVNQVRVLPVLFWLVGLLHLAFSNISNLFGGISTDLIGGHAMSPAEASLYASIDSAFPIVLAPLIGYVVDKYGGRLWFCAVSSMSAMVCFALFRFVPDIRPWIPMLFLSFCTSATPTLMKSTIPLTVPRHAVGTAFGVYGIFESFGGSVGHVLFGYLKDKFSSYNQDLDCLIAMCFLALFITLWMIRIDSKASTKMALNRSYQRVAASDVVKEGHVGGDSLEG